MGFQQGIRQKDYLRLNLMLRQGVGIFDTFALGVV